MKDLLLSIIIPTKDRYKYLKPLLVLLNSFRFEDTEIVIEDNSQDNQEIRNFLNSNSLNYPIVYNHNPIQLPISKNIDNAISHSKGQYVCVIGDDDGLTPLIESYVRWMKENAIESVRQYSEFTYKWPSYNPSGEYNVGATLTYGDIGNENIYVDTQDEVINVIRGGIMSLGKMPCVYQGVVKRTVLDELYKIGGTFFPGPSPDMANAVSLCFVVKKHYLSKIPLIISGGSEFQGGKSKQVKTWVQPLSNVPFISDDAKSKWDKRIPYFWCGNTVWPESGIKGLEYVGHTELLKDMDFDLLLAKCLYRGFEYHKEILSLSDKPNRVRFLFLRHCIREYVAKKRRYIYSLFNIIPGNRIRVSNIISMEKCVEYLMNLSYK